MMNRQTFNETMKTIVSRELGAAYSVTLTTVPKINQTLDALVIRKENSNFGVTLYLDNYFENYFLCGGEIRDYADRILKNYSDAMMEASASTSDLDFLKDKNSILDRIFYRVINRDKNRELLQNAPHTAVIADSDLVLIYGILISETADGQASITITNHQMNLFDLSEDELIESAAKNTPRLFPVRFQPMNEVLSPLFDSDEKLPEVPLWVLSNSRHQGGACAFCYENLLDEIAARLGTSFYVLPSSLHEVLICTSLEMPPAILRELVQMVNEDQVAESDFLSDEVFYYDYDNHSLSVA